mgnify:CR=1 FL=1
MSGLYLQIFPSSLASASRMAKIGVSVQQARLGFDATHLVGMRSANLPDHEEIAENVQIVRLGMADVPGDFKRIVRVLVWQLSVLWAYRRTSIAVVAAHKVWALPLCRLIAMFKGADLVYNCHELETESHGMTGLRQRLAKIVESYNIRACTVVSVVNQPIADWYAKEYGISPVVVGNIPVAVRSDETAADLKARLVVPDDALLYVHTGHLIEVRNIPLIVEVFSSSRHHVLFLGNGHPREPHVMELVAAASRAHSNIHWMPAVPHERIVDTIRSADIGLCLIEGHVDLSDRLSSPNKLFEYLAADLPPLCSDLPIARWELGELADTWILHEPARDLPTAVEQLTSADVAQFQQQWGGLRTWNQEVAALLAAYKSLGAH